MVSQTAVVVNLIAVVPSKKGKSKRLQGLARYLQFAVGLIEVDVPRREHSFNQTPSQKGVAL